MHKINLSALVLVLFLVGGILSSATAQKRMPPTPVDPPFPPQVLSGSYKIDVKANQLSAGDTDFTGAVNGWTAYGATDGEMSGYVFLSMNYSAPTLSPTGDEVRQVTGGSWSKLIFQKGVYAGSVNGRIVSGELVSGTGGAVEDFVAPTMISLELASDSGTEAFVNNVGTGTFVGFLDYSRKGSNVFGTLTLNY